MINYKGECVPFVVCKGCRMVLVWNRKAGPTNLKVHSCKKEKLVKNSKEGSSISGEELRELLCKKSGLVSIKSFVGISGPSDKIKRVYYKDEITVFVHCKLCKKMFKEETADAHECTTLLKEVASIFGSEPRRISVLQNVKLNVMFPCIFPVELDGKSTDFVQCLQCENFLPGQGVSEGSFSHRCHRIVAHLTRDSEKFNSDNLIPLPKTDSGKPRTFKCGLCNEELANPHRAEVHMRSVHGEGGKEVLCTFCGKGFATFRLTRQHELLVHKEKSAGKKKFACDQCESSFTDKSKLKRHINGAHTDNLPFVCDHCGKAFRWEMTLKRHRKTHGEKSVKCEHCDKTFFHEKTYFNHRMTHTGERPYTCYLCSQKFIQITACKAHVLKRHGIMIPKGEGPNTFFEKNYPEQKAQYEKQQKRQKML